MKRLSTIAAIAAILATASCTNRIPARPDVELLFNQLDIEGIERTHNMQGLAISGDYMFTLRNTGICVVIDLSTEKLVAEFPLGSHGKNNHSNVAFFGRDKYDESDIFPLLYVSQCRQKPVTELNHDGLDTLVRLCFAERILTDSLSRPCGSELVQVINYEPENWNSRLWAGDVKNPGRVFCYGNIVGNEAEGNRIIINEFKLPEFSKDKFIVRLSDADIIETVYADEAFPESARGPQNTILQGAFVYDGVLFLPTGTGSMKHPSELFFIDLNKRDKNGKPSRYGYYDYTDVIACEMEDIDLWNGKLVCVTNSRGDVNPVYAFNFKQFKTVKRK